jgi:tyrosine-protein phosphatase SIW14
LDIGMKPLVAPALVLFLSAAAASAAVPPERPAEWAIAVNGTCVKNLYMIEDGLYRGAQPTAAGFQELAALGVKAVLNVAGSGDDVLVAKDSLKLYHVPMSVWGLRDDRVLEALRVMADPANRPLMIHCRHGSDRTGALVALYRVVVQGWTKEKAVEEWNQGGYNHNALWRNLDRYVMKADVEALRKALKLTGPAAVAPPVLATVPISAPAAASPTP